MATETNKDVTYNWRATVAQLVAALSLSLLCGSLGLIMGMPTIVIGALKNDNSTLGLSESEISWFGSIIFIIQPFGSVVSGYFNDKLGRRTCLMVINIPLLLAWFIIYFATTSAHLFIAMIIMGISIGFLEAPILSYIGEICEPKFRGVFSSFTAIFYNLGVMLESIVGATMHWKTMVLFNMLGPLVGFIALYLVPESPAWLLSKGRVRKAEKAYQWLRGWVSPMTVKEELDSLVTYVKQTQQVKLVQGAEYLPVKTKDASEASKHKSTWRILLEPQHLIAFRIIFLYFIIGFSASLMATRPFFIDLMERLNLPIKPHTVLTACGVLQMLGSLFFGIAVRILGKRKLTFLSLWLCNISCLGLSMYLYLGMDMPWVPIILICISYFSGPFGIIIIGWIFIIELFPLRVRGLASGICGGVGYILLFLVTKTFYNLITLLDASGAFLFYGVVGVLGFIYLYVDMPETEGISLEVIEESMKERQSTEKQKSSRYRNTDRDIEN